MPTSRFPSGRDLGRCSLGFPSGAHHDVSGRPLFARRAVHVEQSISMPLCTTAFREMPLLWPADPGSDASGIRRPSPMA
jgi:hypothetical protein